MVLASLRPSLYTLVGLLCAGTHAATFSWSSGTGWLSSCHRVTFTFDIPICVTQQSWATAARRAKCEHVANVLAQLLDNDGDGVADDPAVVAHMVSNQYVLWVPATDNDSEQSEPPNQGTAQMTGLFEAVPNSCDVPSNRGASNTDRSTWQGAIDAQGAGCNQDHAWRTPTPCTFPSVPC